MAFKAGEAVAVRSRSKRAGAGEERYTVVTGHETAMLWEGVGRSYPPKPEPHVLCEVPGCGRVWVPTKGMRKVRSIQ